MRRGIREPFLWWFLGVRKVEWGKRRDFRGDQCASQRLSYAGGMDWLSFLNEGEIVRNRVKVVKIQHKNSRGQEASE